MVVVMGSDNDVMELRDGEPFYKLTIPPQIRHVVQSIIAATARQTSILQAWGPHCLVGPSWLRLAAFG